MALISWVELNKSFGKHRFFKTWKAPLNKVISSSSLVPLDQDNQHS